MDLHFGYISDTESDEEIIANFVPYELVSDSEYEEDSDEERNIYTPRKPKDIITHPDDPKTLEPESREYIGKPLLLTQMEDILELEEYQIFKAVEKYGFNQDKRDFVRKELQILFKVQTFKDFTKHLMNNILRQQAKESTHLEEVHEERMLWLYIHSKSEYEKLIRLAADHYGAYGAEFANNTKKYGDDIKWKRLHRELLDMIKHYMRIHKL